MWFNEKTRIWITAFVLCSLSQGSALSQAQQYLDAGKGQTPFDVTLHSVPVEEILPGGPPKDGIPALNNPKFISASDGDKFLKKHDKVLAIEYNGVAKAYPIRILNWHEVVNDNFNGKPVVVSWCPLCLSGIVYDPENGGNRLTFGVSGKIYKSNLLMYDRETGSLWSQMLQRAITGPLTGAVLAMLPAEHSTWEHWRTEHPDTLVLSLDTGFKRDYGLDPYREYVEEGRPTFRNSEDRKSSKTREKIGWMEPVLGVEVDGTQKAYPFSVLKKRPPEFIDRVGNKTFRIHFDEKSRTAWVTSESGDVVPSATVYWFAWQDFHPQTGVLENSR
ncbi:MAG TPA: DUF3179 domain-containing protein [Terriglobales bacterium]|nr:DUF3179 domain-containing protein [Terriglobales bacterium]